MAVMIQTAKPPRSVVGHLALVAERKEEADLFIADFTARSREQGWNVDSIQVTIFADEP